MADKWYEHIPETVTENEDETCTILWDMPVHADKEIKSNRPDIIVKDYKVKTCLLIDMVVPDEQNTFVKMVEKLSKYKDLEIEMSRMWGLKTETVAGLEKYVERIPANMNIKDLQNISLLGTAHILRKVLSIK